MNTVFHVLKRNRFFTGQLLTAEDLELEQQYFREKLKRHNRSLHGFGVVGGLELSITEGKIHLSPGLALDCQGNEIAVGVTLELALPDDSDGKGTSLLGISYLEKVSEPVPVPGSPEPQNSRIAESFEVIFQNENMNRRHRHLQARWQACGRAHPLTIARLRLNLGYWRIDRRYHPPSVK